MGSEADICNLALVAIGHTKLIGALTDNSDEANLCRVEYPQARDEVLERSQMFVRRSVPAPLDGTTLDLGAVPDEWTYAFALPADVLPNGLIRITVGFRNSREDQQIPYVVEYDGKLDAFVLFTDEKAPQFIYNARVANTALYPPFLARAIGERLGVPLIRGLRKDLKLVPAQEQAAARALAVAIASKNRSQRPDREPIPAHIANR